MRLFFFFATLLTCLSWEDNAIAQFAGCSNPDQQTSIPTEECLTLVELYQDLGGPTWLNNGGWLESDRPCSWFGVSCFYGPNVSGLSLRYNGLFGAIPTKVGSFSDLRTLDLSNNLISGSIPISIVDLAKLEHLNLRSNAIVGEIPSRIDQLTQLNFISLWGNKLSGEVPMSLRNLKNLEYLALNDNLFIGQIPKEIGDLEKLTLFTISSPHLVGKIPGELSRLSSLETLWLGYSNLDGAIPNELANLRELKSFIVRSNSLSGPLPISLLKNNTLEVFDFGENSFTGEIPIELAHQPSSTSINLSYNDLSGTVPFGVAKKGMNLGCSFFNNPNLCIPDNDTYRNIAVDDKICFLELSSSCPTVVDAVLKLFLGGAYSNNGQMTTALSEYLPLDQPYNIPPWNYNGTESIQLADSTIVDWVLVDLVDQQGQVVARRAALLTSEGSVTDVSKSNGLRFEAPFGDYHVKVMHRNHVSITSSQLIDFTEGEGEWDFSIDVTNTRNQIVDVDGILGMRGGDGNNDDIVDEDDIYDVWLPVNGFSPGYRKADYNLSGSVTAFDITKVWIDNSK